MAKILLVEDNEPTLEMVQQFLSFLKFDSSTARNGKEALEVLEKDDQIDVVLMDIAMPVMNGIEATREIRKSGKNVIVIILTAFSDQGLMEEAVKAGADDFLLKPIDLKFLEARIKMAYKATYFHRYRYTYEKTLQQTIFQDHKTIESLIANNTSLTQEILNKLYLISDYRDSQTAEHTLRVGWLSGRIAEEMGMNADFCATIQFASPLHDIGKIGIPDGILLKPGIFTLEERKIMQQHVEIGAEILKEGSSGIIQMAWRIAYSHHERFNGSGYPLGMRGNAIPMESQIAGVADSFDAAVSPRPYKRPKSLTEGIDLIQKNSDILFNPVIVAAFSKCTGEVKSRYRTIAGIDRD